MNWNTLLCDDRIRSYRKASSTDLRTEFEKDYHRIIGSASFRRLQDKTQVFPLDRSDFIRTRLTHSLEVSSLAKSLGQNISQSIRTRIQDDSFTQEHKGAVCDILQCAGLIHDIGNPPFGHFGETSIQDWFKQNLGRLKFKGETLERLLEPQMLQDFYNFEGNTQAFRVVTRLHFLVDEHGMNLTKALLGTIIKYPVSSLEIDRNSGDIRTKKMGYFYGDKENFLDIQESTGTRGKRHPLAFLLEAADDIAYKTADIEDSVKKGCISYEKLLEELRNYRRERQTDRYAMAVSWLEERYRKGVERDYSRPDLYAVQNWIISAQGQMISGVTDCFTKNYASIMEGAYRDDLFAGTDVELLMDALGDIAYRYAFCTRPILKLEIAAQTIFNFLLEQFVNAAIPYDTDLPMTQVQKKLVSLISDNYKKIYSLCSRGKREEERLYLRLLLVTDYICGMTDSYAKDMYQELNGIV
ncbi:MAG: deoxyguanosinetriphosphate triphosphohydrolase [Clostridium sp.]|nr:deoxyguanosinetriphosphate triphosphohydrolase [Clostridium sp.]